VNLGRQSDVFDEQERLVRRNDIAFDDASEGPDATISRAHAHIDYTGGEFRLCDDRSAHGTSVFRSGRLIQVPPGPRGIRLETGDEIYLGKVRLQFHVDPMPSG
jgi:pSer/pThr/pTyr-binding forkhead associated (FHA) protein